MVNQVVYIETSNKFPITISKEDVTNSMATFFKQHFFEVVSLIFGIITTN